MPARTAAARLRPLALALVLSAAAGAADATNLLVNGSFEAPDIGTGSYTYAANGAAGWAFSGAALVNGSGASAWYGGAAPIGMDGFQFAALQGTGSISQAFTATASTLYLGWLNAGRPAYGCCNGDQSYNILLDGVTQGGLYSTASGAPFTYNALNLTGLTVGSGYTLSFQGRVAADQTAFIDGVMLSAAPLAAPPAAPTKAIYALGDPLPAGQVMIDDFDNPIAPGFTFTGGYVRSGALGLDPGMSAPPPGDETNYETVLGGQAAVLTSSRLLRSFSFYMGSPDSYNSVRFIGPQYDFTLNGSDIWLPATGGGTGDQGWGRRISYDFGGYGVNKVVFSSSGNSFEFDDLAGSAVPEPGAWATMIMGFGLIGAASRRRSAARRYRLVEVNGAEHRDETFCASNDRKALAQAAAVAVGDYAEVWRGRTLLGRLDRITS